MCLICLVDPVSMEFWVPYFGFLIFPTHLGGGFQFCWGAIHGGCGKAAQFLVARGGIITVRNCTWDGLGNKLFWYVLVLFLCWAMVHLVFVSFFAGRFDETWDVLKGFLTMYLRSTKGQTSVNSNYKHLDIDIDVLESVSVLGWLLIMDILTRNHTLAVALSRCMCCFRWVLLRYPRTTTWDASLIEMVYIWRTFNPTQ